jgi:hypothetical protein
MASAYPLAAQTRDRRLISHALGESGFDRRPPVKPNRGARSLRAFGIALTLAILFWGVFAWSMI